MRNLKRVLSLALAAIMLMGMMVMGTSAKDISEFPDADQIDDYAREAVAITTGLGIFTGEAGTGNFNPNGRVTRAQLATIICKILVLEGTVDYDLLKGSANSFPDARTYQEGWAEGYINYCQSTGIVRGYPNGTFGADKDVITWHAALALERAIGYYRENEKNGEALDETVVTSKGIEIGLYGDMSLSINHVLTRQELAVMVYNALFAQRVEYRSGNYVKANDWNVVPNNSTEDPKNTLAYGTFYLVAEDGVVMRNSAVDPTLAGTDKVGASTMVDMYDKNRELTGVLRSFEYETGTDLIGHAVTVYYSEAHKVKNTTIPEKVYAMTDQATATGMITYATLSNSTAMDYTTMNRAAVDQGFKSRTLGTNVQEYNINYDLDVMVKDTCFATSGSAKNPIKKGDYILLISNKATKEVEYAIVLKQYLDDIEISTNRFDETVNTVTTFGLNSLYLQDKLENGDSVIVTPNYFGSNGNPRYAVVQAADVQPATVEEIVGLSVTSNTYRTVTADGVKYTESPTNYSNMPKGYTRFQAISQLGETTLVKDLFGQLIAITQKKVDSNKELVYVSQFGYKSSEVSSLTDKVVLTAEIWHADGTSDIITVNTKCIITTPETVLGDGKGKLQADSYYTDSSILFQLANITNSVGIIDNYEKLNAVGSEPSVNGDGDIAFDNGGTFLGVWEIEKLNDGTYSLNKPTATNAAEVGNGYILGSDTTRLAGNDQAAKAVRILTGHSTFLQGSNNSSHATLSSWSAVTNPSYSNALLQTNDTIYWYVDGNYGDPTFSVKASKGIDNQSNMALYSTPGDNDGTWAEEAWITEKNYVTAMVIHGVGAVDDLGVCYYNQGSWSIRKDNDQYVVTFQAFDADGNEVYFSYNYKNYAEAEQASRGANGLVNPEAITKKTSGSSTTYSIPSGYYTFYSNKIVAVSGKYNGADAYAVVTTGNKGKEVLNGDNYRGTVYVADATAYKTDKVGGMNNMKAIYNLFTPASPQAIIYTNARVIDLKDGVYNTVESLYNAMDSEIITNVQISYSYNRANYQCPVLYVINYDYTSVAGGGNKPTTTTGNYTVVTPSYNVTSGVLEDVTIRYHAEDLAQYGSDKATALSAFVKDKLGAYAGVAVTNFNSLNSTATFADNSSVKVILVEQFKVTAVKDSNSSTVYVDSGVKAVSTSFGAGFDGKYLDSTTVNGSAITVASGTIAANGIAAVTKDTTLVEAVQVTFTNGTGKVGETPVSNGYIQKGASLVVTGAAPAGNKYLGLKLDWNTSDDEYVQGHEVEGTTTYEYKAITVDEDVTIEEVTMYAVKVKNANEVIKAVGEKIPVSLSTGATLCFENGSGVLAQANGISGSTYTVNASDEHSSDGKIILKEGVEIQITNDATSGNPTVTITYGDTPTSVSDGDYVAYGTTLNITGTLKAATATYAGLSLNDGTTTTYEQGGECDASAGRTYTLRATKSLTIGEVAMYKVKVLDADPVILAETQQVEVTAPANQTICLQKGSDPLADKTAAVSSGKYAVDKNDAHSDGTITLVAACEVNPPASSEKVTISTVTDVGTKGTAISAKTYVLPGTKLWIEGKTTNKEVNIAAATGASAPVGTLSDFVASNTTSTTAAHAIFTVQGKISAGAFVEEDVTP